MHTDELAHHTAATHRFRLLVLEDALALVHRPADELSRARETAPRHARARQLQPGIHGGLQQGRLRVAGDLVNRALPLDLHLAEPTP